jgi:hypothetical protein
MREESQELDDDKEVEDMTKPYLSSGIRELLNSLLELNFHYEFNSNVREQVRSGSA